MYLYNLLDIISTIAEALVLYVIIGCFCKEGRFQLIISRIIPPILYGTTVIILTYFTTLGAIKVFILMAIIVLLVKWCYTVSFHESIVVMELSWLLMIMLPEAIGTSLMSLIYNGNIMIIISDSFILKWQIYIVVILLRGIFSTIAYRLLNNFQYSVQRKDVAVLTIGFLIAFCYSFISTYGYLNLQMENTFILDFVTSVLCVCFIVQFLYSKNISYLRKQEEEDKARIVQLQQQFTYYQDKLKDEERVRSIYHDLKNHLLMLESRQNTEETRHQIAAKLHSQIADYEDYVHTGNEFLDIILKDKAAKAREKQIDFSVRVNFNGIDFMEPLDISTIFGNAIDNAIEANEELPEALRLIAVKAERIRDMVIITVENSMMQGTYPTEGSTKKDSFIHGFGIPNIKNAVKKYGGQSRFQLENGICLLKIIIPCP